MPDIFYKEESYKIVGLCMEVHRTLGMGFKEITYKEALELEFSDHHLKFERERRFSIEYKKRTLSSYYIADFILFDSIVIEIKAASTIIDPHFYQVISYLKAAELKLGMVINFGAPSLQFKRIVF
jgi:GxxExxY protein